MTDPGDQNVHPPKPRCEETLELFGEPHQAHSPTSKASASEILSAAATLRQKVYDYLKSCPGGRTDLEMQTFLKMDGSTQRPRRVRLVELGMVRDSGRTSKTASGRSAVVWEVT